MMKKLLVFALVLPAISCSLFRAKPAPYPTGVMFPLVEAGRLEFEGRTVGGLIAGGGGLVFFSTDEGYLYCLNSGTREIIWNFANGIPFGCPPSLGPERVFLWDEDNSVFCLDRGGALLWQVKVSQRISSPISLDRDNLYFGTNEGGLLALSQASGELLWAFRTDGPVTAAPVFFERLVCFGSADGRVYVLSRQGRLRGTIDVESPVVVTPLVDGRRLYFGSEDRAFYCHDLRSMKKKWSITAGGRLLAKPWADRRRVYFPASNGVLYALSKSGGEILWWWIAPSRSCCGLEFDGRTLLATSASPELHSLEVRSGKEAGKYEAGEEIRSNPAWVDPYLLFALFDPSAGKGKIVFLHKEVTVRLSASPAPPQPVGTEISFTAVATGFHRPSFEFSLVGGEEVTVVQAASERASWVWYSDKEGAFQVRVRAVDEKLSREARVDYEIAKSKKQSAGENRSAGR